MARIIAASTCTDAWRLAAQALIGESEIINLLVDISAPCDSDESSLLAYNPRKVKTVRVRSARDVANTIFPQRDYELSDDRASFYARHLQALKRGHTRIANRGTWGTYFQRMIAFGPEAVNRLEQIINAMNSWRSARRAAYYIHLSAQNLDALQPMANPCLQYLQFVEYRDGIVDLVVVVRNHDYLLKALGNFVGLARLLAFVCRETGRTPGRLVCHSIHAYINGTKRDLATLLGED